MEDGEIGETQECNVLEQNIHKCQKNRRREQEREREEREKRETKPPRL